MKTPELCEFDPERNDAAYAGEGCQEEATLCVGNFHLCPSCAALPRFRRFKKRPLRPEVAA